MLFRRLCSFVTEGAPSLFECKRAFKFVYALEKEFLSLHKVNDGWRRLFSRLSYDEIVRRKIKYLESYATTRYFCFYVIAV